MTARCKKRRNRNNAIRRAKNKGKELKKLKKTLGLIDEDGMELMDKIKDVTEQEKKNQELALVEKETKEELIKRELKQVSAVPDDKFIEVVNEKTKVKHVYNEKTKRDQFGSYPAWYNPKKEQRKQKLKQGKITKKRQFRGKRMHYIDKTCAWKNAM
ncbi:protein LLP homolog isoform X1 [Anopheles cruzii]|uniref:protein LLP homolog isoform X1 n=1 Tax=Anopheles cruzii TaxID=68878 RepID=UPI0022EC7250|nr:protein LLP homolog isoform X1 [Anopheles cruzii]